MRVFLLLSAFAALCCGGKANAQRLESAAPASAVSAADSMKKPEPFRFATAPILPKDYATCSYGFFCRQELKIEKKTGIPIRLRLGSTAECDRLEQKRSSAVPGL